jgi:hypothetical protein
MFGDHLQPIYIYIVKLIMHFIYQKYLYKTWLTIAIKKIVNTALYQTFVSFDLSIYIYELKKVVSGSVKS